MKSHRLLYILILGNLFISCKKEKETIKPASDINAAIDQVPIPSNIPTNAIKYRDTALEDVLLNGVTSKCTTYTAERVQRLSSFDYFYADDKADIWPGNIVQSSYLRNSGRLVSLGNFPRDNMNYTIQGTMGSTGFSLGSPSNAAYQSEFDNKSKYFWFMPPAYTYQKVQTTYSENQAFVDLGLDFGFLTGGLSSRFQINNSTGKTTMFMMVRNVYFTVSAEYPSNPSGFFGANVNVSDLKRVLTTDNAPAYIASVSYGRVALIKVESAYSQRETKTCIELVLNGLSGSLTTGQKQLVSSLQLTIEAAPGPETALKTLDDVNKYINDGFQFNHRTGCVPVGYEARYLKDNSPLITHTALSYKIIECL
jgi:thiol-activated cytolysin